jgi:para-aminobenzoate synthetase
VQAWKQLLTPPVALSLKQNFPELGLSPNNSSAQFCDPLIINAGLSQALNDEFNMASAAETTSSETPLSDGPRHILYIDAYDSFSNSIVGLLEQCLDVEVTTVRIDDIEASRNLRTILKGFDAVVVGPGPGHPANANDVGLINQLWTLHDADILPILGICLGFQSLALACGAEVKRLCQARHGIVSEIFHCGIDIFEDITDLRATQYHSLYVDIGVHEPSSEHLRWQPSPLCPQLRPLAWDVTDGVNGPILMAIRHVSKPFAGVQFHPESICTSKAGINMVQNWWRQSKKWLAARQRPASPDYNAASCYITPITATATTRETIAVDQRNGLNHYGSKLAQTVRSVTGPKPVMLNWATHYTGAMSPTALVEALDLHQDDVVLLDSQGHRSGRYSILGVTVPDQTSKLAYRSWDRTLRYATHPRNERIVQLDSIDQIWPMLQETVDLHNPRRGYSKQSGGTDVLPTDSPFWGGYMGYISYEAGLETINVALHESSATNDTPDINFAFIHRSIVLDHETGRAYVQSLFPDDWDWITEAGSKLESLMSDHDLREASTHKSGLEKYLGLSQISTPQERHYRSKVLKCQESLAEGNSYELCLTDETIITVPTPDGKGLDPWSLYKNLRRKNPAPFGAFLRLSNTTVVGTSPERFLKWERNGHCEFRPIKGTVKKSPDMTSERAHSILNSSKERAENLMIVDLIRHDLSGVVGAKNCSVSKLMTVEEYEHVYQLVSVVEGQLPRDESGKGNGLTGIDVLKASLPPGSMTGAPKKRSCEILRDIEKRPRGIYSGILGYMDVGGAGDFSVVIRTAVRDSDVPIHPLCSSRAGESSSGSDRYSTPRSTSPDSSGGETSTAQRGQTETWRIGAGGAVTIQSTDEDEFLEMETKVLSALRAFQTA